MVSFCALIFKSSSPFIDHLGIISSAAITIEILLFFVTLMEFFTRALADFFFFGGV